MRAHAFTAAPHEPNVLLDLTQSAIALLAAGGLFALTVSTAMGASHDPQFLGVMMIVAWVAVLTSALLGRQRSAPSPPRGEAPQSDDATTTASRPEAQTARDTQHPTPAQPAPPATPEPAKLDEPWLERLLEFAQQTLGALQGDRLRLLISQQLPALIGREDIWVVASVGGHQQV